MFVSRVKMMAKIAAKIKPMTADLNETSHPSRTLPPPAPRQHLHDRKISYRGYLRDDGLWDIEGQLRDSKTYPIHLGSRGDMPPGENVHHMQIRVTIDDEMVIHDIAACMPDTPYLECQPATQAIRQVVGLQMGRGWKRKIEEAIGGLQGCTHIRELLAGVATAAYQTIYPYRSMHSLVRFDQVSERPKHLGQCTAWDLEGAVVQRYFPQFAGKH